MENTNYTNAPIGNELKIIYQASQDLAGAAKWAKFLAIFNLTILGLAILFIIIAGSMIPGAEGIAMIFIYLIGFGIAAIPLYFLYTFSTNTQDALSSSDENSLAEGLANLRKYFLIQGIFTIIGIVLMVFSIVIMLIVGGSMMSMMGM